MSVVAFFIGGPFDHQSREIDEARMHIRVPVLDGPVECVPTDSPVVAATVPWRDVIYARGASLPAYYYHALDS